MTFFETGQTWIKLFVFVGVFAISSSSAPGAGDRKVVVVVWDGMRPDFVTQQYTPTAWKLASEGVLFRNHHAVYPSATNVNGTAMATGVYPGHSGIVANHEFRPAIDSHNGVDTADPNAVRKGDDVSGNKYIACPTVAQLARQSGGRTVIASAKTIGLLLDREVGRQQNSDSKNSANYAPAKDSFTLFAGDALPREALLPVSKALGPFPKQHVDRDAWTTRAMVDVSWKENVPMFSVLWLGEPDLTQHETAPGAPEALDAIKSSDENLGRVLAALDRHHASETTDIFLVSDHGFSTIERSIDLERILNDAGFDAVTGFVGVPRNGQILMIGNGGSVLFYVIGHDAALTQRLVEFLQQSDFAGVIFTRAKIEGTFSFATAKIDDGLAPDVEMAFRWNENKSQFGVIGMIDADWQRAAGKGTHATLSRFDMHNTLIAAGPDFRRGYVDDLPSGNVDLAPTILRILRLQSPSSLDGRVLSEAMKQGDPEVQNPDREDGEMAEATKKFRSGTWRQNLKISRIGSTTYFDEGNGRFTP